jgi:phosphate transport system substrate-binding protein
MSAARHLPFLAGFLILALGCSLSCSRSENETSLPTKLVITGSSTIAPLMSELALEYERLHPGVRIDVQSGGSGRGIADARNGEAQFGMVSRALRSEESDLRVWPIARDGVAMIVHESNPLQALSSKQVQDIYSGRVQTWEQLGGEGGDISVVHKASGRATLDVFLEFFDLKNPEVQADIIAGENEQAIKTVVADPRALAYVSIGTAEADIHNGVAIKLLALDGVAASTDAVAQGVYAMARPLNVVAAQKPLGVAAAFLAFIRSSAAAPIIRAQSFTPLQP